MEKLNFDVAPARYVYKEFLVNNLETEAQAVVS